MPGFHEVILAQVEAEKRQLSLLWGQGEYSEV